MSATTHTTSPATDRSVTPSSLPTASAQFRNVNIRRVPEHVWRTARQNALASGLPFRDYLIELLAHCQPIRPEPSSN